MWDKEYRDYPKDHPLIQEQVSPHQGIVGCEMHDINGWGNTLHIPKKKKRGRLAALFIKLFGGEDDSRS